MYEDISDYSDEERRAVYFYELLKEAADLDQLSPVDQFHFEEAEKVLAQRQLRLNPPMFMAGYGYFTPVPGQERFQLKLMAQIFAVIALLIGFIYAFFIV